MISERNKMRIYIPAENEAPRYYKPRNENELYRRIENATNDIEPIEA